MNRTTMLAAAAFAWQASAQTTTMQVPSGSGTYPTIGQIECLEEEGSGRYCAATYECADGSSGDLWGDMANHLGRRVVVPDHPIANRRDCEVEVDGKAAVQWFHGFRPEGRDGEIVSMANARVLRPIYEGPATTTTMVGAPSGSMWAFLLERHDTTLREVADVLCRGPRCERAAAGGWHDFSGGGFGQRVLKMAYMRASPWRQCVVDVLEEEHCYTPTTDRWQDRSRPWDCHTSGAGAVALHLLERQLRFGYGDDGKDIFVGGVRMYHDDLYFLGNLTHNVRNDNWLFSPEQGDFSECWTLAVEEAEQIGLELEVLSHDVEVTVPDED